MAQQIWQDLDFLDSSKLLNVPYPESPGEPATKQYVDELLEGLKWKEAVKTGSQSNVTLNSAPSTIDGITLLSGDRILIKAQTNLTENGIYIFDAVSTPLVRSLDANITIELLQAVVTVIDGTDSGITFRQSTLFLDENFGTDDVVWTVFGTGTPPASEIIAGAAEIATQAETNAGLDDTRFVTPLKLASWTGSLKRFTSLIGDNSSTLYTIEHNLNTRDVTVAVYRNSGNYDEILVEIRRPTVNTCEIIFSTAPSTNLFNVVVVG